MTLYELMIKANDYLIKGGTLTDVHKAKIVKQFMDGISTRETAERFYNGVKFPKNTDETGRQMYPIFYIPPYNGGKKLKTVLGQTPGTHILSANMYELEILRLLHMFAPDNPDVRSMITRTLERLKSTCYGKDGCGVGECYDTSIVVLRFLAAVAPDDRRWINERIRTYYEHYDEKKRPWYIKWYFWLCLSELPYDIAEPHIKRYGDEINAQLTRTSDGSTIRYALLKKLCKIFAI